MAKRHFSELGFAREVAEHIGSEHHEVRLSREEFFQSLPRLIWHEDEPIVWPSSVSLYFVARLAREKVTVVLTGEGSDETLAGYTRYAWTLLNSRMDSAYRSVTPEALRRLVRNGIQSGPLSASLHRKLQHTFLVRDGNSWPSFYFDNFFSAFAASEQSELLTPEAQAAAGDAYAGSMHAWERSHGDLLHRLLYTDINSYLIELLMKQDQMSMAASLESRVPFLDHELVEFTARIPAQYSIAGMAGKFILKQAVEDLLPQLDRVSQEDGLSHALGILARGIATGRSGSACCWIPEACERGLFRARSGAAHIRRAPHEVSRPRKPHLAPAQPRNVAARHD